MKLWWAIPLGALIIIPSTRYLLYRDSPGTEDTAITKNLADSQLNNISNSKTPETTNPTPVRPKNVNTDNNSDAADFSVSGYIRNIENMPVSGISVVGSNNNDTPTDGQAGPIKTQSGEDGYYRIEFDRGGIYTITIEPTSEYRGAAIEVSSASDSADITISEIADAVVYGRIIDDNGLPISNALITEGIGRIRTRSDSNGNYRIRIKIPDKRYPRM
ncbi:MAG: carboxypeptidase-like regulatory domain-containing protein, partial [Gammaproteobacteria bacterium]|nr:carboxypeptidase-like regulatory domain-containing protein [Gammaproteobacteria bacterium]